MRKTSTKIPRANLPMVSGALIASAILFVGMQTSVQAVELSITQNPGNRTFSGSVENFSDTFIVNRYALPYTLDLTTTYLRSDFVSKYYITTFGSDAGAIRPVSMTAETVGFFDASAGDFYAATNSTANGIITHNGSIYAENGFSLESGINPSWSYGDPNADLGSAVVTISQEVKQYYDADPDSWLYNAADFFNDVSKDGFYNAIRSKGRDLIQSNHWLNDNGKKLFLRVPDRAIGGVRGSIDTKGTSIFTASPGNLVYDLTFGDDPTLTLPFAFGDNKDDATLEIFFNDTLLASVDGVDYELDELSFVDVDISSYAGMTGELNFVLNTTGTQSANVFIPESLATVPVPAAVWLFGSGLIGLVGVSRRKRRIHNIAE